MLNFLKGNLPLLGKLLGIASIGEAISSFGLARKFVADLAIIISMAVIGAMLTGAMAIFALYECNALLVRHGLDADMSALITAVVGLLALGGLGAGIAYKIKQIKTLPFKTPSLGHVVGGPVQALVKGFYHGVTHKKN